MGFFYDSKVTFIARPLLSLSSSQDQKVADDELQIRLLLKIPRLGTPAIPLGRALWAAVVNNDGCMCLYN